MRRLLFCQKVGGGAFPPPPLYWRLWMVSLDNWTLLFAFLKISLYFREGKMFGFFSWCSPCFSYGTNASRKGNFENCLWKKLQNFRLASNLTIIQFSILHGQKLSHDSPQCNWMLKTFQHSWVWKSFLSSPLWPILINFAQKKIYTGSLAPADFCDAVFTFVHFQKIAKISSLCDFHYISEGILSLMRFWLLMI